MTSETLTNKIINKTIYIIIFLIPLLLLPSEIKSIPYNTLKYVTLLACGLILLVVLILKRKELKFDLIDKTLIAFYFFVILSTIFSVKITDSIFGYRNRYEGLLTFTIYLLVYYCGKYFFQYNKKLKIFAMITISISCVIAILQYYNIYDTVNIYVHNEEVSYYLTYNNDETEYTSIYDSSKQYSNDSYEIFFGGNKSIIDIRTNSESESKLLLIKDSYANSFIPFILNNYREIIVIDPRYYHEDINSLINDKQITDIMLYYNMNTFFEDTSLDDMIENIKL